VVFAVGLTTLPLLFNEEGYSGGGRPKVGFGKGVD